MEKKIISKVLIITYSDGSTLTKQLDIENIDENKRDLITKDISQKTYQVIEVLKKTTTLLKENSVEFKDLNENLLSIYLNKSINDLANILTINRATVADKLFRKNKLTKSQFTRYLLDFYKDTAKENILQSDLSNVLLSNVGKFNLGDTNYINENLLKLKE